MAKGVVAAGSVETARAAAEILASGGNAVDAAVAACMATAIGEPSLTSLLGGGILLHRDAATGTATYCDFFANAPGLGAPPGSELHFVPVDIDFGPTTQRFQIGRGAAAVPGVIPGLMAALERWGSGMPLAEIVAPACRMLREGVVVRDFQAVGLRLLEPILLHSEAGRRIFGRGQRVAQAGDHLAVPAVADTLEALAGPGGWRTFYEGELVPLLLAEFGVGAGGLLTAEDFARHQVVFRAPLVVRFHGADILLNPPPAFGGRLVGLSLALLETVAIGRHPRGGPEHRRALATAMRVVDESRRIAGDPLEDAALARWRARFAALLDAPGSDPPDPTPGGPNSTTHISVVDAAGNAVGVTFTHGEGCGYPLGGTGIVMNNLMGEEDLFPNGFHSWPAGERLATGVCPTILLPPEGGVAMLGTGGSNRIRTALVQVLTNLLDFRLPPAEAVEAGRIHWEAGVLNVETFDVPGGADAAEAFRFPGDRLVGFPTRNMFFGGVHTARKRADGTLEGAGDPRRGGTVVLVP